MTREQLVELATEMIDAHDLRMSYMHCSDIDTRRRAEAEVNVLLADDAYGKAMTEAKLYGLEEG